MALVVSVLVTYFLYKRIKQQYGGPSLIKVVASTKQLETGTPLAASDVVLMDWPSNVPLEGAFHKPEDVTGRVVMYPIALKEPVREALLAAPGATVGLTAKIPDGMRAVAVVTNELNNVSGFLFPGSHVDIVVTLRQEGANNAMTTTFLQNVEVLSTGEKLQPNAQGKPENVKVVTVLLAPDDAEKLMLATNQGTVQFVLRNASDQEKPATKTVDMKDLQGIAKPGPLVARKAAPPKPPSTYTVEQYDGAKKGAVKF